MAKDTIKRILTTADPTKLVKHPLSLEIYGEIPDPGFDASVAARGVDEPIVVAADGKTIISGVRRRNAAIKARMKEVPIYVRKDLVDQLDIEEAIIEANRHNEQTNEAKARAFKRLKEIEELRASIRMKSQLKQGNAPASPNLDEAAKGRADVKAAGQAGMKKTTARKAAEVVAKIDEATAAGDKETAADLRETLNTKSVDAAHKKAAPPKPKRKKATREKPTTAALFDQIQRQHFSGKSGLPQALDTLAEACGGKGENYKAADGGLNVFLKHGKEMRKGNG